jgi:hypothetical protein
MLSNDDLLAAIDLTVDFHGNEASVEEHGMVLLDVNRNQLCVQHGAGLDQTEWWPTTHCMYGLQACLDSDGSYTCAEAESGAVDDLTFTGGESDLENCDCSLEGVTSYCLATYSSVAWSDLDATCDVAELAKKSSGRAAQADGGATLWVTIDGVKYTYADGAAYGGTNTEEGFGAWAARVMGVTCQAIQNAGSPALASCAGYFPPV